MNSNYEVSSYKRKNYKKIKAYRKSASKKSTDKTCQSILDHQDKLGLLQTSRFELLRGWNVCSYLHWIQYVEFGGDVHWSYFEWEILGRNWSRKINLPDWYETWYLDQFENAEFVGNVIFFCFGLLKWSLVPRLNVEFEGDTHTYFFGPDIPFLDNFCPKNQNHLPKMKLHTNTNSNMLNSMVMSKFSLLKQK